MSRPSGIIVFGANGSGKTTLARELARILNYKHIDHEDYAFNKSDIPYTDPRTSDECNDLMLADIKKHRSFVISAVTGDFGDIIPHYYDLAIHISAPLKLRLKRIEQREYERHGERVREGGDMYESRIKFMGFVNSRPLEQIEQWANSLACSVISIDGTDDWHINATKIALQYQRMFLYHYFEKSKGSLLSLSALPQNEADSIQNRLVLENKTFAAQRNERYLPRRKELEQIVHKLFVEKGGKPEKDTPHYFVIGECPWLATWYEQADYIKIPIKEFDLQTVSFTYGDTFPTFSPSVTDGMEYRNTVYTYEEALMLIEKYGMPQDKWDNPVFAQPCYVEAQVWSDEPVLRYKKTWESEVGGI